ncbi:nitrogenase molybdenum-iron protein subunit beta [Anaerosacchariphilus polymeriproducens]|uniref:Nitrogenase molybdenum-iron protein beta chain n=1 Tax=Anaerosacchariphilus polymeriproducens TaxID=1812858 RepID=A0A371AU98_9FIRM|nr:nitrogenase molybdenum-iron protein subunit beta [Anaerosacchariphilus polymeriproducens]RDU23143.1 nitrogenase molybdenum-iron protein subunit beta [Anaerosacchariphilus polymeriproducens]
MLNYTNKKVYERTALRINPVKTCQPVGAMYAALGVHRCLPHSHGSQGCCAFHRMFLTRHFKEPAMASSSSFTEGASVFGGGSNLKTAAKNIFDLYDPDIIAVHTTCLSETIGDDLNALITEMKIPEGKYIVHCNTPSYKGSHIDGYTNMVSGFINNLAEKGDETNGKICVFPGFVNPGDVREYKRLLNIMKIPFTMLPDTSGVMDSPMTGKFEMYPKGGTTIKEIKDIGNCTMSLALGLKASEPSAQVLEKKLKIPYKSLDLPMGVEATDKFIMTLQEITKEEIPYSIEEERGQLVDIMIDIHPYTYGKKAAIFGDPDTVLGITAFVLELGMIPKYVVTGTPGTDFVERANLLFKKFGVDGCIAKESGDLFLMHQWIKNEPVDLLIGGSYGKHIARAEDIPLVRMGFPIIDRYIHSYVPLVGYKGAMRMAEFITNALMDYQDSHCKEEDLEVVM